MSVCPSGDMMLLSRAFILYLSLSALFGNQTQPKIIQEGGGSDEAFVKAFYFYFKAGQKTTFANSGLNDIYDEYAGETLHYCSRGDPTVCW